MSKVFVVAIIIVHDRPLFKLWNGCVVLCICRSAADLTRASCNAGLRWPLCRGFYSLYHLLFFNGQQFCFILSTIRFLLMFRLLLTSTTEWQSTSACFKTHSLRPCVWRHCQHGSPCPWWYDCHDDTPCVWQHGQGFSSAVLLPLLLSFAASSPALSTTTTFTHTTTRSSCIPYYRCRTVATSVLSSNRPLPAPPL